MKFLKLLSLSAVALSVWAAPASADPYYGPHNGNRAVHGHYAAHIVPVSYHGGYRGYYGGPHRYRGSRSVFIVGVGPSVAYYPAPAYVEPAYPTNVYVPQQPQVQQNVYVNNAPTQDQYCREYQAVTTINGQASKSYGTACRQPDGTWEIVN